MTADEIALKVEAQTILDLRVLLSADGALSPDDKTKIICSWLMSGGMDRVLVT